MGVGPGGLSCYLIVGHSVTWYLELSVSDGVTDLAAWMVHVRSHLIRYALPLRLLVACLTDTLQGIGCYFIGLHGYMGPQAVSGQD